MRLFIAVDVDEEVRRYVADVMARVSRALTEAGSSEKLRWVEPGNVHITLCFLGHVDEGRAAAVRQALSTPLLSPVVRASVGALGSFPPGGRARVIWLGLDDGVAGMLPVHHEVQSRMIALGLPSETRPFSAHLTLARVSDAGKRQGPGSARSRESLPIGRVLSAVEVGRRPAWTVDHVTLYQSRLSSRGPTYLPVMRTPLQPAMVQ